MKIRNKDIKELKTLYNSKTYYSQRVSNTKKTLEDRNGKNEIELKREGKKIKLTEKTLWQELYYGGEDTQAGEILKGKYPELFELLEKDKLAGNKLNSFTAQRWGFFFSEMSLPVLMELVIALVKYQLNPLNWFRKR